MKRHCSSLLVQVLVAALHGAAFVPIASADAYSADWKRPETTRRYLQAPFAERLVVSWREGKVTVGEVRHERDWSLTAYGGERTTPRAFGVWLVDGETGEPFDFKAAHLRAEPDATPIHGQFWRRGELEVDLEACAPFGRRPSAHLRLSLTNHAITNVSTRLTLLVRSAAERDLVFSAPDLYNSFAPTVAQWRKLPCAWTGDAEQIWRDGDRFLTVGPGLMAVWDAGRGGVSFTVDIAPNAVRRIDWTLGEGEVEWPDYDNVRARVRTQWQSELARVADRPWLVRRMVVEMLQCFSRPVGRDYALPRQGGLQRWVWPGDQLYVSKALGLLGYREYVEAALDFYFDACQGESGEFGPFGNSWACNTACVLYMFASYCLDTGNAAYWARRRAGAERAFGWIKAKRGESAGRHDCIAGLFPPMKATDAGGAFQAWGHTDLTNLMAMEAFVAAAERFSPPDAEPFRNETNAYRAVIVGLLEPWRREAADAPYFRLPLDPTGREDETLRRRNYFYSHTGRFASLGFLSQDELLKLRNWLVKEGFADERGLYMRQPTCTCWDTGKLLPYGLAHNVWYTTSCELGWFTAWRAVGRDDLAQETFKAMLKYSVTAEGCVGERYCSADPWFFPWSPNASGAGRIVLMALGCGLNVDVNR